MSQKEFELAFLRRSSVPTEMNRKQDGVPAARAPLGSFRLPSVSFGRSVMNTSRGIDNMISKLVPHELKSANKRDVMKLQIKGFDLLCETRRKNREIATARPLCITGGNKNTPKSPRVGRSERGNNRNTVSDVEERRWVSGEEAPGRKALDLILDTGRFTDEFPTSVKLYHALCASASAFDEDERQESRISTRAAYRA
ncbi:hypothetical protein EVAR_80088_1 [Eumeta japonica]|uniref:Uncharacterized protein n=1 Tax=Eumeta variegata TaxID=151549 RepID=A0A4C1UCQ8_EUMVA|nr:hypothetical protein EVAR_80088_1 [Eumeta japonica]